MTSNCSWFRRREETSKFVYLQIIHRFDIQTNGGHACFNMKRERRDFGVKMWWMASQTVPLTLSSMVG